MAGQVNKSGRGWREPHKKPFRSLAPVQHVLSVEERLAKKAELTAAKAAEAEYRAQLKQERREKAEKMRAVTERRKEAKLQHALKDRSATVIKDPKKIKKMDAKARKSILKLSPETLKARFPSLKL